MKSKECFRVLTFVVVALLVCSVAAITSTHSSTTAKAASVPTGLHVVGNQIEDGSGRVIIPHGANRMGTEYACRAQGSNTDFDGPVDQASVSAMLTWDVNIVRVPLNEDCWLGINGEPANGKTVAQYQADIMNWVSLLNQNGMIVILELHWNNSGTNQSLGQEPMPDLDHAPTFWTSVANTFKSNSSIIFDLYNEPFTSSWTCWKNGSTAPNASPCTDVPFAAAGMQTLVNTVRATGATNILMLGGLAFSNDLSGWLANEPTDPRNDLVASTHIYSFNTCSNVSCWVAQVAPVKAKVPVLAGEIGENDCTPTFINTLMSWLDGEGIGYLAWTWTVVTGGCNGSPVLISDYTGTPTAFGLGYKAHLLALGGGSGSTPTPTPKPGTTPTPTPGTTPTPTPPPSNSSCKVVYTVVNQWAGGFQGALAITNTSSTTINSWSLGFSFANGQTIMQMWNATPVQSGSKVTVTNLSYDGTIAPSATLNSVGFQGTWNGTNAVPSSFTLNGVTCS